MTIFVVRMPFFFTAHSLDMFDYTYDVYTNKQHQDISNVLDVVLKASGFDD